MVIVISILHSGAQSTIISKACAERCGILHLMDTRFQGIARGVGTAKIFGRIHLALMTLGSEVFEITFTVMDSVGGGYDVLLGLDMLRKHAAVIDLRGNCLRIGGASVPFLGEKDIPLAMREEVEAAPPTTHPGGPLQTEPTSSVAVPRPANSTTSDDVARIVELGFTREEAESALRMCDGDADQAIRTLISAKFDS